MRRTKKTICWLLAFLAVWAGIGPTPSVRADEVDAAKVRKVMAAYLYNFAKFIEWPAQVFDDENAPFEICVLNDEPLAEALAATVQGKRVAERRVEVRRSNWSQLADRAKLRDCHALFIGASKQADLTDILAFLEKKPAGDLGYSVLTVSQIDGFAPRGGMIGFVLEEGRIVFEINIDAMDRARLNANSKLLRLARIVREHPQQEK